MNLPICTTFAQCSGHDGRRIHLVGTYTLYDPYPERKEDHDLPRYVEIMLDSDRSVMLSMFWREDSIRSKEEIARFQGKKVRVTGTYHRKQPPDPKNPPEAAAMVGPCIHPIEAIELAQ